MGALLQEGVLNHFWVSTSDKNGREIIIGKPHFEIKYKENVLKTPAPLANLSIGFQNADSKTSYDILRHVIKKNSPLPAQNDRILHLG